MKKMFMALFKGKRPQGFGWQITLNWHTVICNFFFFLMVQYFHGIGLMFQVLFKGKTIKGKAHICIKGTCSDIEKNN